MIAPDASMRLHLAREPVDFRKSIDGLSGVVRTVLQSDPLSGHLFIFHNHRRTGLKMLWWEQGGFCLFYKRLAKGRFRLPPVEDGTARLTREQLTLLLEGFDLSHVRRLPRWNPEEKTSAK